MKEKVTKLRTKSFIMINDVKEVGNTWHVYRKNDESKIVLDVNFTDLDQYKCCNMSFVSYKGLSEFEYEEIINKLTDYITNGECVFIQTKQTIQKINHIFEKLKYTKDPIAQSFYLYERPLVNWIAIYMCLGVSIGTSIGSAMRNLPIGVGIGVATGLLMGAGLQQNFKKERDALINARINRLEYEGKSDE